MGLGRYGSLVVGGIGIPVLRPEFAYGRYIILSGFVGSQLPFLDHIRDVLVDTVPNIPNSGSLELPHGPPIEPYTAFWRQRIVAPVFIDGKRYELYRES